eukprot:5627583-Amphidinium_carterae.1
MSVVRAFSAAELSKFSVMRSLLDWLFRTAAVAVGMLAQQAAASQGQDDGDVPAATLQLVAGWFANYAELKGGPSLEDFRPHQSRCQRCTAGLWNNTSS